MCATRRRLCSISSFLACSLFLPPSSFKRRASSGAESGGGKPPPYRAMEIEPGAGRPAPGSDQSWIVLRPIEGALADITPRHARGRVDNSADSGNKHPGFQPFLVCSHSLCRYLPCSRPWTLSDITLRLLTTRGFPSTRAGVGGNSRPPSPSRRSIRAVRDGSDAYCLSSSTTV